LSPPASRCGLVCPAPAAPAADPAAIKAAIEKGSTYLIAEGQAADGSFSSQVGPAVTALAVTALVQSGTPADDPAVAKALAYLLKFRRRRRRDSHARLEGGQLRDRDRDHGARRLQLTAAATRRNSRRPRPS